MTSRRALPTILLAAAVAAFTAVPAAGATKNGIRPISPKPDASVPTGQSPVFKMRVTRPGKVWVHVCKSSRRNAKGVICHDESIGQARKRDGVFRYRPRFYDFPEFWLNTPGRYFWQAHRIDCTGNLDDCLREGPVVRFRVG